MASTAARHAVVFGASGLAGWAVVDQLLRRYPSQGAFSKVTAVVNKPLDIVESRWPVNSLSSSQPAFSLASGVDLRQGNFEDVAELLKRSIIDVETVTHVFYFAYAQNNNPAFETQQNQCMIENTIGALNMLAPDLQFVVVPTGTKAYGILLQDKPFTPPFREYMEMKPKSGPSTLFYDALHDVLNEQCQGRKWTWCDVRPDIIVGFAPRGSVYNLAGHWATYLSLYAQVEGAGAEIPYPGNEAAYHTRYSPGSADIIAKFSIWASLNPDKTGDGQVFNIADQSTPSTMAELWPKLASYFGLNGTAPAGDLGAIAPTEYISKHENVLSSAGISQSIIHQPESIDFFYGFYLIADRQLSLDKARSVGFAEAADPTASWLKAFDMMKKAGMVLT